MEEEQNDTGRLVWARHVLSSVCVGSSDGVDGYVCFQKLFVLAVKVTPTT